MQDSSADERVRVLQPGTSTSATRSPRMATSVCADARRTSRAGSSVSGTASAPSSLTPAPRAAASLTRRSGVREQRSGGTLRQPSRMPRNLQTHETILVLRRGSQRRARAFHQARHRPDGCDADVRDRIGQQPCAVSAVSVDARAELRQCVERGAAHAGNVVVQHRSEPLRGAGGAECPSCGDPAGVSAIPECLHRDLDGPAISNPPQGAGDICNQREIAFRAQTVVAGSRQRGASPPFSRRQLASAARIRSAVAASASSAAGVARRKSMSFTPSIGTRWTCA